MFHSRFILILRKLFPQKFHKFPKYLGEVSYFAILKGQSWHVWLTIHLLHPEISHAGSSHMQVHGVERQFASETQGHHHHACHPEEQDIMAFFLNLVAKGPPKTW